MTMTRDEVRSKLFSSKVSRKKTINMGDFEIEVRPIPMYLLFDADPNNVSRSMFMAIAEACYVPGTDEKVFDKEDYETFMNMPLTHEFKALLNEVSELMNLDVREAEKN